MPRTSKRRRSTKHRGNAAGMIEARGRTGRKPTAAEKGGSGGRGGAGRARTQTKSPARTQRYARPPTWKGAGLKAVLAAVVVYILSTLLVKKSVTGNLLLLPIVLALYAPLIYYTDMWMYRRYQRKQAGR